MSHQEEQGQAISLLPNMQVQAPSPNMSGQEDLLDEEELLDDNEGGYWQVTLNVEERRVVLIWVEDDDPDNFEYVFNDREAQRRGLAAIAREARAAEAAAHGQGNNHQVGGGGTGEAAPVEEANDEEDSSSEPEYFWPNIQRYIGDPSSGTRPSVRCAICMQGLFHPGLCSPGSRHRCEGLEVLECGHVIGRRCWGRAVLTAIQQRSHPCCPFCRAEQLTWFWTFDIGDA